ncbi:hypothetical protein ES703_85648 [subsurface metagenome]
MHGDDCLACNLLPVQEKRIVGYSDHITDHRPVIHCDHAVFFDECRAGKTTSFRIGINRIGKVAPMDQIVADGVSPVLTRVFRRIRLVEQVPAPLPETESVRVVKPIFRVDVMIDRSVRVTGHLFPRLDKSQNQGICFELRFLLAERIGEGVFRDTRGVVGSFFPGLGLFLGCV